MSAPPALPGLRVALELGHDGDRCGAWLVDLPGAFGWARDVRAAVSQSGSVAGWWREWLARHGEPWPLGDFGWPEVVEEVAATTEAGHTRHATLRSDCGPVAPEDLEIALRRLDHARSDLLVLVKRLAMVDPAPGERPPDQVLRHLADVEVWLGSRLDPSARYPGRLDEPDPVAHLSATRAWAVDNLRRLHATADNTGRTDSKGDSWTFAKVVRRYVYHSIEHLRELERRVAIAEGRAASMRWSHDRLPDVAPLARLLRSVGWDRRAVDLERLQRAIDASRAMVGAWDGDELVAFARELGDGEINAVIAMVIVDPRWQGLGLASRVMHELIDGRPDVRFSLGAAPGVEDFYARLGFEPDPTAMVRPRRRG